jgi:tyrosyl-tRNA synthetase
MHIGHYSTVIATAKRFINAGHKPIILLGGATGLIGDPKQTSERPMISKEKAKENMEQLKNQIKNLLGEDVIIVNNIDWMNEINSIDFLRDYGKHFNVNYMLSKDTVKRRLDIGISYTEFSYMILQAIDFLELYENYGCTLQIGGQDQWGNITAGLELIRKIHGNDTKCYCFTTPLILKADGTKFGKSESGESVWLDKIKTSPYEMYQFFINVEDAMVIDYLKKLTFLDVEKIKELEESLKETPEKREASKTLAYEVVKFIHGEEEAENAKNISEQIFQNKNFESDALNIKISDELFEDNFTLIDLLFECEIASSKSEARRLIEQGGIKINDEKIEINRVIKKADFKNNFMVISKGKKNYYKLEIE